MTVWERLQNVIAAARGARATMTPAPALAGGLIDLPLFDVPNDAAPAPAMDLATRREAATVALLETKVGHQREAITLAAGLSIDADDYQYRRVGSLKNRRRDLTPVQQDRMLEISWYLWEQNPFAKRLIQLTTDLILGEGVSVQAKDERLQEVIDATWNHRINQLKTRLPEFNNALELNGELILPVETNPITGRPILGFIDPSNVLRVELNPLNNLQVDAVVLRADTGSTTEGQRLKVVQANPETGYLEGEVFYLGINKLPNSSRGRSSLLPLADWLDLYDQYLFAEVERLHLLSSFVWDYTIENATAEEVKAKVNALPNPKPGSVFGHNEKEKLEARTPSLNAADRSEAGRMLRTHIAGSAGFPLSYLGEIDSNRATIDGQNDVMLKTPARKQKEFAAFLETIVLFTVQQATRKNGALFRGADPGFKIVMPEIQAKDVSRVGQVLAQVVSAMDTAMANKTASRQLAVTVTLALLKHLGVEADVAEVLKQADLEAEERQAAMDLMQERMARTKPGEDPDDPDDDEPEDPEDDDAPVTSRQEAMIGRTLDILDASVRRAPAPVTVTVESPNVHVAPPSVTVAPAAVTVEAAPAAPAPTVNVHVDRGGGKKTISRDGDGRIASISEE